MWFTVAIAVVATASGLLASIFAVSRMLAMLTELGSIPHSRFGMPGGVQKHTLDYTAVAAGVLAAFLDLGRIASLGAILYLTMDMIVHWAVHREPAGRRRGEWRSCSPPSPSMPSCSPRSSGSRLRPIREPIGAAAGAGIALTLLGVALARALHRAGAYRNRLPRRGRSVRISCVAGPRVGVSGVSVRRCTFTARQRPGDVPVCSTASPPSSASAGLFASIIGQPDIERSIPNLHAASTRGVAERPEQSVQSSATVIAPPISSGLICEPSCDHRPPVAGREVVTAIDNPGRRAYSRGAA